MLNTKASHLIVMMGVGVILMGASFTLPPTQLNVNVGLFLAGVFLSGGSGVLMVFKAIDHYFESFAKK